MADSRTTLSLLAQALPGLTLQDTQQTSDENTSNTLSLFAEAFPGLTLGDTEQATDAVQVTNFPEFADLPSEIQYSIPIAARKLSRMRWSGLVIRLV